MRDEEAFAAALNRASFAAADLVYAHSAKFPKREDYRPLDELAQAVQSIVVREGVRAYSSTKGSPQ